MNKSCVAACLESVRMAVESVSGCAWNECPDQRGITVRMCVEWVSESAWNPQTESSIVLLAPENPAYTPIVIPNPEDLVIWGVCTFNLHDLRRQ